MVVGMLSHVGFEEPNSKPKIASYPIDLDLGNIWRAGREFYCLTARSSAF